MDAPLIKRGMGYMAEYPVFGIGIWTSPRRSARSRGRSQTSTPWGRSGVPIRTPLPQLERSSDSGLIVWASLLIEESAPPSPAAPPPVLWRPRYSHATILYATTSFLPVAMIGLA